MKIILFKGLFLFSCFCGFAQTNKNNSILSEIKPAELKLEQPAVSIEGNKQISGLIVIDARYDSSSYGFYQNYPDKYYSLVAEKNAADDINDFLKNYLRIMPNNSSGRKIIMVIKKLWATPDLQEDDDEPQRNQATGGGVIAKFEFYCSNGEGYAPLYRFDTACGGLKSMKREPPEYITRVLTLSVQKLLTTDFTRLSPATKNMSFDEIILYSNQQSISPIVTASTYQKGVYKTFDEFKMNAPSILNYEIEEAKLTKTIFLNDGKGAYPVRDLWGYCDGSHLYINSADNYFELIKNGNTFISNAARSITRKRHIKAGNVIMLGVLAGGVGPNNKKTTYNLTRKFYELDMETGELY